MLIEAESGTGSLLVQADPVFIGSEQRKQLGGGHDMNLDWKLSINQKSRTSRFGFDGGKVPDSWNESPL